MDSELKTLDIEKLGQEFRSIWQGRALAAATGTTAAVLLSVLAHNYDDAMPVLLRVVKPNTWDPVHQTLKAPFLSSAGRVRKDGAVVADMVTQGGVVLKGDNRPVLYLNEIEMRDDFRRLADRLKLRDAEREEMFKAVQRWVVADTRLDPNFDPKDPDARRLTQH